ncbi:MAG: hypothetical protein LUD73_00340 [Lachnospiraceae bacterium]|nr:hypothetical protein [Lachnospiraceae bacterium]
MSSFTSVFLMLIGKGVFKNLIAQQAEGEQQTQDGIRFLQVELCQLFNSAHAAAECCPVDKQLFSGGCHVQTALQIFPQGGCVFRIVFCIIGHQCSDRWMNQHKRWKLLLQSADHVIHAIIIKGKVPELRIFPFSNQICGLRFLQSVKGKRYVMKFCADSRTACVFPEERDQRLLEAIRIIFCPETAAVDQPAQSRVLSDCTGIWIYVFQFVNQVWQSCFQMRIPSGVIKKLYGQYRI